MLILRLKKVPKSNLKVSDKSHPIKPITNKILKRTSLFFIVSLFT